MLKRTDDTGSLRGPRKTKSGKRHGNSLHFEANFDLVANRVSQHQTLLIQIETVRAIPQNQFTICQMRKTNLSTDYADYTD